MKYKINMKSGKTHIVEKEYNLTKLNEEINRSLSLFIDNDTIIRTKHIESVKVM